MSSQTIAVAMSGGVDSSTVAAMLRAEGHSVIGLTMQLWNQRRLAGRPGMPESVQGRCCSLDDVYDARRVAETIGIPYYVVNHEDRFERDVVRPFVQEYRLDGRSIYLLAEGRLVNLSVAEGHPAAVMDMSFANQSLAVDYVMAHHAELGRKVYDVPVAIDREVARLKLRSMGVRIDALTPEQETYLASWESGT